MGGGPGVVILARAAKCWGLGSRVVGKSGAGQINTFLAERNNFVHYKLLLSVKIGRSVVQASSVWSHSGEAGADASKHAGNA